MCGLLGVLLLFLYLGEGGLDRFGKLILRRVTPADAEIPGTYVSRYPFGTDTFVLAPDQTFIQEAVILDRNQILRSSGTWTYDSKYLVLNFDNGFAISDGNGNQRGAYDKRGRLSFAISRHLLSQRLYIGGDQRFYHEKLDAAKLE